MFQSEDLQSFKVITLQKGNGEKQFFTVTTDQTDSAFFRIFDGIPNSAIDSDADGIPDLIELENPSLNPLDPADGAADPDGDERSTSLEIQDGTDPVTANPKIVIEVENLPGTNQFEPLRNAIVPTLNPTVRFTGDLPAGVRVFIDRDDFRAGINGGPGGLGKEVTADFTLTDASTLEGSILLPDGVNRIVLTSDPTLGALVAARMLNYGNSYEDTNGNGQLDAGEDRNLNGVLDPGEDLNNNGELDATEDLNRNGLLEENEDFNKNGFLDGFEDLNGNLQIDHGEDFDNDNTLGDDEDLNLNGLLDQTFAPGVAASFPAGADLTTDSFGLVHQARTIILTFQPTATPVDISRFLQGTPGNQPFSLRPIGIEFDDSGTLDGAIMVTAFVENGEVGAVYGHLNDAPGSGFPPSALPAFPLASAIPNLAIELSDTVGERLPRRLLFGNDINNGQGYDPANGGFDRTGNSPDELTAAWPHFYMQSYLAQSLVKKFVPIAAEGRICVIDRGFGAGGPTLPDLPASRIRTCFNLNANIGPIGPTRNLRGIRSTSATRDDTHGVRVALCSTGDGTSFFLGTAQRTRLRAIHLGVGLSSVNRALKIAARDASISTINMSFGFPSPFVSPKRAPMVGIYRAGLASGLAAVIKSSQLIVLCAANHNEDLKHSFAASIGAPHRLNLAIDDDEDGTADENRLPGADIPEHPLIVVVGATGAERIGSKFVKENGINGNEYLWPFSNYGDRLTVTAPGTGLARVNAITNLAWDPDLMSGTSYAAPFVSGILADLDLLARLQKLPFVTGLKERRIALVRFATYTADDLGTKSAGARLVVRRSDDPGNSNDPFFGHGRVNYWKATLSVLNHGISAQDGRPAVNGKDPIYQQIPVREEADTKWYGFEIITNRPRASVWIDGVPLEDSNALTPSARKIKAYKGVNSTQPSLLGIKREDPMAGIVPVGSSNSEYRVAFSIERKDLLTPDGKPRMLELRTEHAIPTDKPFFQLRLELDKMRSGSIPGVSFDDFVFEITPTDFGDAPTYYASQSTPRRTPVIDLPADGGRGLNSNMEWFGPPTSRVTPEPDARQNLGNFPDISADADGVPNTSAVGKTNRDGADDGFRIPRFFEGATSNVKFQVSLAPSGDAFRYANPGFGSNDDRNLYLNGWIDWNRDAVWDDSKTEAALMSVKLKLPGFAWDLEANSPVTRIANSSDTAEFQFQATPPLTPATGEASSEPVWARFRLDYGENAGRRTSTLFESNPGLRLSGPQGGATRYGEVEDYPVVVVKFIFIPLTDDLLDPTDKEKRMDAAAELGSHGLRAKSTVTDILRSLTFPEEQSPDEQAAKIEALRSVTFNGGFPGSATLLPRELTPEAQRAFAHVGVKDNLLKIQLNQPSEAPLALTLRGQAEHDEDPGPLLQDLGLLLETPDQVFELSKGLQEIITSGEATLRLETEDLGPLTGKIVPEPSDLDLAMEAPSVLTPGTEATIVVTPTGGTAPWNVGIMTPWGAVTEMEIEGPTEILIEIPEEAAGPGQADLNAVITDFSGFMATNSITRPVR